MEAYKLAVVYRAYHEGLRDVAKERHAASVQQRAPARMARLRTAAHAAAYWLRGRSVQTRGEGRMPTAPSLTSD